ncbi:MAG: hypothetical protein AAF902_16925 [Chloroflexota bacterium]
MVKTETPPPPPLITENAVAFVDVKTGLVSYKYRNIVSSDETAAVYNWILEGLDWFDEDKFRGAIFDFRDVKKFALGNMVLAKETSQELNDSSNFSIFPISMVVANTVQEVKVRMSMMGGDIYRKHISQSPEGALDFINQWNEAHDRQFDNLKDVLQMWPTLEKTVAE